MSSSRAAKEEVSKTAKTILSDSTFWAYDNEKNMFIYSMPSKSIQHYAIGGADLLSDGILKILDVYPQAAETFAYNRVYFLHMPSTLHKREGSIKETDYKTWKTAMLKKAPEVYAWAQARKIDLYVCLLIDPHSYDEEWIKCAASRELGQLHLRRIIEDRSDFESADIHLVLPDSTPTDWFSGHWSVDSLDIQCGRILELLELIHQDPVENLAESKE